MFICLQVSPNTVLAKLTPGSNLHSFSSHTHSGFFYVRMNFCEFQHHLMSINFPLELNKEIFRCFLIRT